MAIEHDYFGLLESGPDGSIFWSETVDFADQRVTLDGCLVDLEEVLRAGHAAHQGQGHAASDQDGFLMHALTVWRLGRPQGQRVFY